MVQYQRTTNLLITLIIFISLLQFTTARKTKQNRRRAVIDPPSVVEPGWTVPLEGAETCVDATHCTDHLSAPPTTSTLQFLAIGRGTITYTCNSQPDEQPPVYVGQNVYLYDASSLIHKFSSEEQFHSYIPRFLQYDYTSLDNSSLTCIGQVARVDDNTVVNLYGLDAYPVSVTELVNSPGDEKFDLQWAHSQDDDREWDIYRVETSGGLPPYNCGDQVISDEIPVEYVAEYWLYRQSATGREGKQGVEK